MTKSQKTRLATPSPRQHLVRQPLTTVGGLLAEAAKVYRQAREGKMDADKARSLVWILGQIRAMVETQTLADIEARLEALAEGRPTHAYQSSDRQAARPH